VISSSGGRGSLAGKNSASAYFPYGVSNSKLILI
jgi:hypothetical protein